MNIIFKKLIMENKFFSPLIITGSSQGIGKSLIDYLKEKKVITIGISRTGSCESDFSLKGDVGDYESLKKVYKEIKNQSLLPKGLINCAGIASMNLALTTPPAIVRNVIQTNLIGTIYSCQIFSPFLIKAGNGRIINFSTIAVGIGLKGESIYAASKSGVETFTKILAKELSNFSITANCIAPGPIQTNLLKGIRDKQIQEIIKKQIINKKFTKQDICKVVDLILSEEASSITGEVINIGGL